MSKPIARVSFVAALVVLGGVCGGCAWSVVHPTTGEHGAPPLTRLTMVAVNTTVGRAVFRLRCSPAGGNVPDPERACAALESAPRLITSPKPFVCPGGTFSWWAVTVSGRLDGKRIHRAFATCWTTQMATLGHLGLSQDVLQKHLSPR